MKTIKVGDKVKLLKKNDSCSDQRLGEVYEVLEAGQLLRLFVHPEFPKVNNCCWFQRSSVELVEEEANTVILPVDTITISGTAPRACTCDFYETVLRIGCQCGGK